MFVVFGAIAGILFGLYMIAAAINIVGVIIGAVFSGLIGTTFSSEGLAIGIVLGLIWYSLRKRNSSAKSAA